MLRIHKHEKITDNLEKENGEIRGKNETTLCCNNVLSTKDFNGKEGTLEVAS